MPSPARNLSPESPRPDPAFQPPTSAAQGRASASPRAQAHAPHTEPKCLAHAPSCGSSSPAHHRSSLPPPRSHRSWSRSPPPPKKPCPPTLSSKQLNHRNSRAQGTATASDRCGYCQLSATVGHTLVTLSQVLPHAIGKAPSRRMRPLFQMIGVRGLSGVDTLRNGAKDEFLENR